MSKKRIGLWATTAKSGSTYLSGPDKEAGLRYFIFKDKKDEGLRNVCTKPIGDFDAKFNNVISLATKTFEKDGVESTIYTGGDLLLGENMFYYENDEDAAKGGVRHLTRKDGSVVMGKDGTPLEKPSHTLVIG